MPLAREIYQEGIRIPPVLLMKGGKSGESRIQADLMNLILANVRTPEERKGDLMAQIMANRRGEERLTEIVARYGLVRTQRNAAELLNYSERVTRAMLRQAPDGEYCFEDFLDDDGVGTEPVRIAVCVRISGDRAQVDFAGSSPQTAGPVNANYAIAVAAAMYCFRCLIGSDVPYNAGLLRPIRVIAPERSVVNAGLPSAMAAGNVETSQRITDAILGALAKALPDRIPAASSGTMSNISFGGWDSRRNRAFSYYETIAGGMGASTRGDGCSADHTHMTNSWNTPVEAFEHEYPVTMRAYKIRTGSGGKGMHTGGDGIVRELQFLDETEFTFLADRQKRGPYGLAGGTDGKPGSATFSEGEKTVKLPGKTRRTALPGSRLSILTPGGGGFGEPRTAMPRRHAAKQQ
jgi:N-methylhydantoinase B/oxoprolinase/acetone carboxylase alpha subunit